MQQSIKSSSFNWILFGFILHAIGGIFFNSSKIICYILCGLGLVIIFSNVFFRIQNIIPFKGNILILFILFLLWNAFIIMRPFFSSDSLTSDGFSLISPYTWLSYITPLIVFLGFRHLSLRSILMYIYIYCIIGIILLIINYQNIFNVEHNFDLEEYQDYIGVVGIPLKFLYVSSFMVLSYTYVPSKYRIIAFLSFFISLFTVIFTARRSSAFMYLIILIFFLFLYARTSKNASKIFKLIIIITVIIVGILIFMAYADSTFSFFLSRLDKDTRSSVEYYFFQSFKGETIDWIIGRGINGTYYCPIFDNSNRGMIETGYLHLILKGGIIYLILYIILLAHSAYIGFFRTSNILTKAMALYLVAHILYLIPWGLPAFSFEYIIVWVCIYYCQSKKWRLYPDLEIRNYLSLKKIQ